MLAPQAVEDLHQLTVRHRANLKDALEKHLRHRPNRTSRSRIKHLGGLRKPQYRLRVGEIRVFYDVRQDRVEVLAIVAQSSAQAWLEALGVPE